MTSEDNLAISRLLLRPSETLLCASENGKLEDRILAIISNTQAGVEESCVFIIKRTGLMAGVIQTVLPIYFDFRISVAQTKPVERDDKQLLQESKNDFTLKLLCDQAEASVQTDDLETLQGLLRELRRSHLIAQDDNFYAGGSSHRWVQFYTVEEDLNVKESANEGILTMDEFMASTSNPLSKYFLQPEDNHIGLPQSTARLDLGLVKESWVEKEMRARESEFTEYSSTNVFVGTWNVNGKNAPEKLDAWLKVNGEVQPDIYVLCFQELDLSAEAYIVLDGSKEEEWTRAIAECLGNGYHKVMSKQLVGLLIVMYAAEDHVKYIKEVTTSSAGVGIMGMLGNKGGVAIRIRYKDSYLCFIDSHLAADTNQFERRNQDYQEICRRLSFPSNSLYDITKSPAVNAALSVVNRMASIFDCDHTIWAGDLNYRLALPEDQVKSLLKSNDFDTLLKYDQLTSQKTLLKTFLEFEEHLINFPPTYKYDVGTDIWDSSEKRRVPSYTDRILWRSKNPSKDSVNPYFYKSHMELKTSDHKPVSAFFKLKVKTLIHEKQAEVHQAIVRDLDKYENECMPDATLSSSNIVFEEVRYLEPKKTFVTIKNTGQFPAQYRFKPKLQDERFCKPWIWVNPPVAMIMPGESAKIHITVMVDNESAPMLNMGKEQMDDILILHLEHGKDYFISVSGSYIRTCFGNSLEWLSRLDRPIRLWNPEDNEDEDEDDTETLFDVSGALETKLSTGNLKDTINNGDNISKRVKSVKSVDSLFENGLVDRKTSIRREPSVKKQKAVRQLSLPKDLWRIVDFIYKHGFSVDNLFLLSGDQATMSYIRECLDTGEEFDLTRLLDKSSQDVDITTSEKTKSNKRDNEVSTDLKPQIARPVSIMNGIPPKASTFGLGENTGIHSMAEVLLRFLESLQDPVVPTEMYYRALEKANQQQAAYGLLDLMPPVHVNVFVYITSFLRELILVGGSATSGPSGGKEGGSNNNIGSTTSNVGGSAASSTRILQNTSGSIYNGVDATGSGNRGKREDEDYRVAKLASVFSSVMLRPPPGAERLSEVEALKRKNFLMQFLQEPVEEEGLGGITGVAPTSALASSASTSTAATTAGGTSGINQSEKAESELKD